MTVSILLVHADPDALRALGSHLERLGGDVIRELTADAGLITAARVRPEIVVLHHDLAGGPTLPLVERFRAGEAGVIVLAPSGDDAVRAALEAGAELTIPIAGDPALLTAAVTRTAERVRARRAAAALWSAAAATPGLATLGTRAPMLEIGQQIDVLAQADRTTVLLRGEHGAGKRYVARLLHDLGPRAGKPFLACRCAGLTPTELDSVLFGHEKGACSGATARRQGLLELADGGTLLLSDVGDLAPELQPKLLRFLESRTFRRLGGTQNVQADTRLLAASERPLAAEVEAERFREDLFFRLAGVPLELPPLRDRALEDRDLLLDHLHREWLGELTDGPPAISPDARERLLSYGWPGNVAELRAVLGRALLLARGQPVLGVEYLPGELRARAGVGDRRHTPMTLAEAERQQVERALRFHGGNRTRTAKELGVSRATLITKVKLYQLDQ